MLRQNLKMAFRNILEKAAATLADESNPMLAHVLPKRGPWFEGWYTRVVDPSKNISFGVITTSAMKTGERLSIGGTSGYVAVLIQAAELGGTKSYEVFPKKTSIGNLEGDFDWSAAGYGTSSAKKTSIQIPNNVKLEIKLNERRPWSETNDTDGPEGALAHVRYFPLHWFVWNTGGTASYEIEFQHEDKTIRYEGEGLIHQEKNWGAVFPPYWMWAQAMNGSAYFSLAGSDVKAGPLTVRAYLVGYRSAKFKVDFNPAQWIGADFTNEADACKKTFRFSSENADYRIEIDLSAPEETFASLAIPTLQGYLPNGAIESFNGVAVTRLYQNTSTRMKPTWDLVETQSFTQAALEFGGLAQICE